jgi:hypothetical protein
VVTAVLTAVVVAAAVEVEAEAVEAVAAVVVAAAAVAVVVAVAVAVTVAVAVVLFVVVIAAAAVVVVVVVIFIQEFPTVQCVFFADDEVLYLISPSTCTPSFSIHCNVTYTNSASISAFLIRTAFVTWPLFGTEYSPS